jgi:hypothetical protein
MEHKHSGKIKNVLFLNLICLILIYRQFPYSLEMLITINVIFLINKILLSKNTKLFKFNK